MQYILHSIVSILIFIHVLGTPHTFIQATSTPVFATTTLVATSTTKIPMVYVSHVTPPPTPEIATPEATSSAVTSLRVEATATPTTTPQFILNARKSVLQEEQLDQNQTNKQNNNVSIQSQLETLQAQDVGLQNIINLTGGKGSQGQQAEITLRSNEAEITQLQGQIQ